MTKGLIIPYNVLLVVPKDVPIKLLLLLHRKKKTLYLKLLGKTI